MYKIPFHSDQRHIAKCHLENDVNPFIRVMY